MDIHASIPEKVKLNKVNRFIELWDIPQYIQYQVLHGILILAIDFRSAFANWFGHWFLEGDSSKDTHTNMMSDQILPGVRETLTAWEHARNYLCSCYRTLLLQTQKFPMVNIFPSHDIQDELVKN